MEIYRITDLEQCFEERQTYNPLEMLTSFSLVECRGKKEISTSDTNSILFLDHFDEAEDPTSIWKQIESIRAQLQIVIIVDQSVHHVYECLNDQTICKHVLFPLKGNPFQNGKDTIQINFQNLLEIMQNNNIVAA